MIFEIRIPNQINNLNGLTTFVKVLTSFYSQEEMMLMILVLPKKHNLRKIRELSGGDESWELYRDIRIKYL